MLTIGTWGRCCPVDDCVLKIMARKLERYTAMLIVRLRRMPCDGEFPSPRPVDPHARR